MSRRRPRIVMHLWIYHVAVGIVNAELVKARMVHFSIIMTNRVPLYNEENHGTYNDCRIDNCLSTKYSLKTN